LLARSAEVILDPAENWNAMRGSDRERTKSALMVPSDSQKSTVTLPFPQGGVAPFQEERAGYRQASAMGIDLIKVVDYAAALGLAILTLPILVLSLFWVMLTDGGNPFFTQMRIGLHGKPFRIFKIRTMHHDRHGKPRFCAQEDDRILPGGQLLRKTRIDELPQLFNVLRGDMALVGPRPEQPAFVESFIKEIPGYADRHGIKPGITGLAQITQGYVDSLDGTRHKLDYDLLYIRNRSLGLWCSVVLGTVRVVLFGHGAR
jgi:lipopolysaccharide/colanic/teichoic acid biosynthesis glycosyltransferase